MDEELKKRVDEIFRRLNHIETKLAKLEGRLDLIVKLVIVLLSAIVTGYFIR